MVDSRDKGTRAELVVRDLLRSKTGLNWERTPMSGALNEKHGLKSDLYVPNEHNLYAVEVKHYKDDHFNSSIFTSKNPQLMQWWEQAVRQGKQLGKKPLLLFKHDRSKVFAAFQDIPMGDYVYSYINWTEPFYVARFEDWFDSDKPEFIKI